MISKLKSIFDSQLRQSRKLQILESDMKQLKSMIGKLQSNLNLTRVEEFLLDINKAEFKVYSQWGDDGLIDFLVAYLDIDHSRFVEFGVENYSEANTRFLTENKNWSGLIMDGSEENMNSLRGEDFYWRHNIKAISQFVTAENIEQLLIHNGFGEDVDLLHIDIDGNDYWIWKAISCISPAIVIVEYNSLFGFKEAVTVPYDPTFVRKDKHFSTIYYGSSISALEVLAKEKGYSLIATNDNANNAYFVRDDKLKQIQALTAAEAWKKAKFREARNESGELQFLDFKQAQELICKQTLIDVRTGRETSLEELNLNV